MPTHDTDWLDEFNHAGRPETAKSIVMFYNIRQQINYTRFTLNTRALRDSRPIGCDPNASCEVHTMLGARDLHLYLLAVKSLLRFIPSVAVTVHSDGTLQATHESTLRRHIPGCRLISPSEADGHARDILGESSYLFKVRSFDPCYRRLIDTELLARTPKRIVMDSDVLTIGEPHELIEWIRHGENPFLIGQPPRPGPTAPVAKGNRHVQSLFEERLDEISEAAGLPHVFLRGTTAGFYGIVGAMGLDRVERLVQRSLSLGLPMRQWGGDQCVVIHLLSATGANRFEPERYLNFCPDAVDRASEADLIHFYGTFRFYKDLYLKLASEVVEQLR